MAHNWLSYVDKLQRQNSDTLAFYPLDTLNAALDAGKVLMCEENGEPAGYLWHGAIRPSRPIVIYQACIDYDLRRQQLGHGMVRQLVELGKTGGATAIRLRCRSSSESTLFWEALGFYVTHISPGGKGRGAEINHFWTDLRPILLTAPKRTPSNTPINWSKYQEAKKRGVKMPSRFSRNHY